MPKIVFLFRKKLYLSPTSDTRIVSYPPQSNRILTLASSKSAVSIVINIIMKI